jgi:hypothetical protein
MPADPAGEAPVAVAGPVAAVDAARVVVVDPVATAEDVGRGVRKKIQVSSSAL